MKKTRINSLEELFELYPNKRWDFDMLANNLNMTTRMINALFPPHPYFLTHPTNNSNPKKQKIWKWYDANVTMSLLQTYPDTVWNWKELSKNPNLTWEVIQSHLLKPWDWNELSRHRAVTWDIIQTNPTLPWNWHFVSLNPNITWNILKINFDKEWSWCFIPQHPNISCELIAKYPFFTSTLSRIWSLSSNNNITLEFVENNSNLDWNWHALSSNPNISFEEMTDHLWKPWFFENINPQPNVFLEINTELHLPDMISYGEFLRME